MPFNNVIARGDVPAREETIDVVMDGLTNESAARKFFREIRVGKNSQRFPVLSALPMAYWVNGDTGLKQTSEMAWTNKFVTIEELAVIVPVPQNVVDDSDFDIWAEARPKVGEAIDRALDAAIFFGINAPASFPTNVTAAALAAGNAAVAGTSTVAEGGFFGDVDAALETVEDDGFSPSGWVMDRKAKGRFRRARNSQGDRIDRDRISANFGEIDGLPIAYTMDGMWPQATGSVPGPATPGDLGLVGDWQRQFVLALRKDVTYEVFREGVVQDNTGAIVYNLMQQDMIALRVTFRAGWQVANTINYAQQTEAQRYPAAVLQTPGLA
jgi:HK97 family phage major capsid protein